jgi:electron transfer flavoprotein alpha/beta subunit
MEFLVCVKQVPDDSVEIHLNPETKQPDLSGADPEAGAFDTYAEELAVRFIEADEGSVTVLSAGTEDNKTCLKNSLAVGASAAYLVADEGTDSTDSAQTAALLAAAAKKIEADSAKTFDVILCGMESTDAIGGQVGALLAEKLGLPLVENAVEITKTDAGISVKQETDTGFMLYEVSTPAVVTVSKPDYDPRYPTIRSKMAARKAQIPVFTLADLGIASLADAARVSYTGFEEPKKREAGIKINEKEAEDAVAKAMDQLIADKVL